MIVIDSRRDVGTAHLSSDDHFSMLNKYNIKYVKVKQRIGGGKLSYDNNVYVIYRDKKKVEYLLDILKTHNGFLKDRTVDDAIEFGRALEYDDESINDYIKRRYSISLEEYEKEY